MNIYIWWLRTSTQAGAFNMQCQAYEVKMQTHVHNTPHKNSRKTQGDNANTFVNYACMVGENHIDVILQE